MAAENDNAEKDRPKFTFEGIEYDLPSFDFLSTGEWMLLYKYARVTVADTVPLDDPGEERARVEKLMQPATWCARFHIAYKRANPKKTDGAIEAIVEKIDLVDVMVEVGEQMVENPTSASEQETSSEKSPTSPSESLSLVSSPSSEIPEETPAPTGTSG